MEKKAKTSSKLFTQFTILRISIDTFCVTKTIGAIQKNTIFDSLVKNIETPGNWFVPHYMHTFVFAAKPFQSKKSLEKIHLQTSEQ
jgi:hypothetical protein